jgi:hypothetical protein
VRGCVQLFQLRPLTPALSPEVGAREHMWLRLRRARFSQPSILQLDSLLITDLRGMSGIDDRSGLRSCVLMR